MSEKWIVVRNEAVVWYYAPNRVNWGAWTTDITIAERYASKDEARKIADSVGGHIETVS